MPHALRLRDRWATVGFVIACTSLPALALAAPLSSLVTDLWGHHAGGDSVLLRPGGFHALETVRLLRPAMGATLRAAPLGLVALSMAQLVPWGGLLAALTTRGRMTALQVLVAALDRLPPLVALLGTATLVRVGFGGIGYVLVDVVGRGLGGDDAKRETIAMAACGVVALALLSMVRVWHDLAQAAVVLRREGAIDGALTGLEALRRRPGRAAVGWAWRAVCGVALVVGAAALTTALDTATTGGLIAIAAAHQGTIAALVVLRAAWLREALALVGHAPRIDDATTHDEPIAPIAQGDTNDAARAPLHD